MAPLPGGDLLVASRDKGTISRVAADSGREDADGLGARGRPGRARAGCWASRSPRLSARTRWCTRTSPPSPTTASPGCATTSRDRPASSWARRTRCSGASPRASIHNGGRIAFGPDKMLYAGTGETGDTGLAQDKKSLGGKILRMTPDGRAGARQSGGRLGRLLLRAPQCAGAGLGQGQAAVGGRVRAEHLGRAESDRARRELRLAGGRGQGRASRACVDPVAQWKTDEASPSGIAWAKGSVWMAGLRGERLWRIPLAGTEPVAEPAGVPGGEVRPAAHGGALGGDRLCWSRARRTGAGRRKRATTGSCTDGAVPTGPEGREGAVDAVFNMIEELFAPGRKHTDEEKKRLELSRNDVNDGDPGRGPIDLDSGKVTIRIPGPAGGCGPARPAVRGPVEEPEPVGQGGGLAAAGDAQLGQDVGDVDARRLRGDEELLGDLAVGAAGRDQAQDVLLAGGQAEGLVGRLRGGAGACFSARRAGGGRAGRRAGPGPRAAGGSRAGRRWRGPRGAGPRPPPGRPPSASSASARRWRARASRYGRSSGRRRRRPAQPAAVSRPSARASSARRPRRGPPTPGPGWRGARRGGGSRRAPRRGPRRRRAAPGRPPRRRRRRAAAARRSGGCRAGSRPPTAAASSARTSAIRPSPAARPIARLGHGQGVLRDRVAGAVVRRGRRRAGGAAASSSPRAGGELGEAEGGRAAGLACWSPSGAAGRPPRSRPSGRGRRGTRPCWPRPSRCCRRVRSCGPARMPVVGEFDGLAGAAEALQGGGDVDVGAGGSVNWPRAVVRSRTACISARPPSTSPAAVMREPRVSRALSSIDSALDHAGRTRRRVRRRRGRRGRGCGACPSRRRRRGPRRGRRTAGGP